MGHPKFCIKKSTNDQFYFNLRAVNSYIILSSETYVSKQGCKNGINSVQRHAADDKNYERKTASNGQFFFNLRASNGEVIGKSEMYTTKAARDNGINAVKRDGTTETIEENC